MLGGEIGVVITIVPLSNGTYYAALDAQQRIINRIYVEVKLKGTQPMFFSIILRFSSIIAAAFVPLGEALSRLLISHG